MEVGDRLPYLPVQESSAVVSTAGTSGTARAVGPLPAGSLMESFSGPRGDSSDLSSASRLVAEAAQLPEVRQDKVAGLQQQIASGGYQVAPQDVADAMLRHFRS